MTCRDVLRSTCGPHPAAASASTATRRRRTIRGILAPRVTGAGCGARCFVLGAPCEVLGARCSVRVLGASARCECSVRGSVRGLGASARCECSMRGLVRASCTGTRARSPGGLVGGPRGRSPWESPWEDSWEDSVRRLAAVPGVRRTEHLHDAPSTCTTHRAPCTEHRARSTEHRAKRAKRAERLRIPSLRPACAPPPA